jgi:16S rRNA processing protein RimM
VTAYLAVARFRKPHGLKGEAVVTPLTDEPHEVFVVGRRLVRLDEDGKPGNEEYVISRTRPFHRKWLLQFEGIEHRDEFEGWPQIVLGADKDELREPEDDEMYVHEISGADVVVDGKVIGKASHLIEVPSGDLLAVNVEGKEMLFPFKSPILVSVDRRARRIELDPPEGLLDVC